MTRTYRCQPECPLLLCSAVPSSPGCLGIYWEQCTQKGKDGEHSLPDFGVCFRKGKESLGHNSQILSAPGLQCDSHSIQTVRPRDGVGLLLFHARCPTSPRLPALGPHQAQKKLQGGTYEAQRCFYWGGGAERRPDKSGISAPGLGKRYNK